MSASDVIREDHRTALQVFRATVRVGETKGIYSSSACDVFGNVSQLEAREKGIMFEIPGNASTVKFLRMEMPLRTYAAINYK